MTPVEHPASAASAAFGVGASRSATAAMTRARASVIRAGGLPVATRPNFGGGGVGELAGADRHPQHHAAGAQRPAGDPVDEIAQGRAERRPVEGRGDRL